ncbi:MAG: biopolymer transporter ExbD [Burkholderiaceae bacterium]|nr:biopolymer transporter ExbD [Burkholderiaceae bacterium]
MNFRRGMRRDEPEINFIPLIDVLLVILIFLMVTTTYSKFTELKIDLPSASAKQTVERPDEIVVGVSAEGRYRLAGTGAPLSQSALIGELRRRADGKREPVLVIHADAGASHQAVVDVLDAARQAGLERVTFAAQSAGSR